MTSFLIVGSSSGIGRACVDLALKDYSSDVIGVSRSSVHIASSSYTHYECDVSNRSDFSSLLEALPLNSIDNFVLCVGTNQICQLPAFTDNTFDHLIATNLYPAFLLLSSISRLVSRPRSVVLLGSIWSSIGVPGRSIYGATKGALASLAMHASSELSPTGTLVNTVSPGFTDTPLTSATSLDPLLERPMSCSFSKQAQSPFDVALSIFSLLKPSNNLITGQEIFVDSGITDHG